MRLTCFLPLDVLYWTDSYEKTIKRAALPDPNDPEHGTGYSQNLELKGLTKPVDIAVDWVARYEVYLILKKKPIN